MSEKDLIGNTDFQRWMIENNLSDYAVEIERINHTVMMSKYLKLSVDLEFIAYYYYIIIIIIITIIIIIIIASSLYHYQIIIIIIISLLSLLL